GHYWHNTEHSLSLVNAHLQAFLPKLSPSVQRYVLQGAGTALFHHWEMIPFPPAEIERSPRPISRDSGKAGGWECTRTTTYPYSRGKVLRVCIGWPGRRASQPGASCSFSRGMHNLMRSSRDSPRVDGSRRATLCRPMKDTPSMT